MRIKRLEIQGFKSFKDKTVIYFDNPITGIVGPNGSGKSNIVDAFFWVMGEQSYKHIRSSGSDDIIFKGSSKYQPLGMAEATLVLEQNEVDPTSAPLGASADEQAASPIRKREISVTRRVYRSGEGEYFINGVQARLKDIHELFLDTGAGAKGYSVIEQGQIDKIVNSKPEDRRLLIEDAAGIAKYKARKKESLKKLEGANQNLARINDVLTEIDRSLASLERQAQKARRYKEYRAQLLEKETAWGRRKYQVLNRQQIKIAGERTDLEQVLSGLRAELSRFELEVESRRISQVGDSKGLEQLQAEVERYSGELTRHQSALDLSKNRQEDIDRQLVQLSAEKDQIEEELGRGRESIATKNEEFAGIDAGVEELLARVSKLSGTVTALRAAYDGTNREAEQNRRALVELAQGSSRTYSRIAALDERIQGAESQMERVLQQESEVRERMESGRIELETLSENLSVRTLARTEVRESLESKRADLARAEAESKTLKNERDQALKALMSLGSRLKSLEELEKAREGMADGPKKALEWSKESGAPFAVFSDFIEVEPGYEGAVEAVLGHAFDRLVSSDSSRAMGALRHLQQNDAGTVSIQIASPASGFLADTSRGTTKGNSLKQFVRLIAPEGLSGDDCRGIHSLIDGLASSIEVLDAAPDSSELPEWQASGRGFVTKDGVWFDPSEGVLSGGSATANQAGSVLSRKRVIQELRADVAAAETRHETLDAKLETLLAEIEATQGELSTLSRTRNELEIEVSSLEGEKSRLEREIAGVERTIAGFASERERFEGQVREAQTEIESLRDSLAEMAERKVEIEAWIANHESALSTKESGLRTAEAELQELRIREASATERRNSLRKEIETEQRFLQGRERRFQEVDALLETFRGDRSRYSDGDHEHGEEVIRLTRLLSEKRSELAEIRNRYEAANSEVTSGMERIRELHREVEDKSGTLNRLTIDLERVGAEIHHLKTNMEEKYGFGCLVEPGAIALQEEMTDPVVTIEMSEEEEKLLHAEVEDLRDRIRRLGEVNTMAVEEYEMMRKRHDHLSKEKADLETSMNNLNEAIEHINKTSVERFERAFEAIASRFEKLFPIIFGGGQAKLSLAYPEGSQDILEAGVEILAQPPGKKISNMTLLSGGEKALTALSLIFAIFMVKPSPFCILDEVDAPLDDSNIGKFNALVREMSAKSQFILVTHNKKTMELNDALYGVTMEEPGVSRMVSIQLQ